MFRRILVAVDGSRPAAHALDEALRLASTINARLRIVHVLEAAARLPGDTGPDSVAGSYTNALRVDGQRLLDEAMHRARELAIESEAVLLEPLHGRAGEAIVDAALRFNADLVVVGTQGRKGLRRALMGSDAEFVVRHAAMPVMSIRLEEDTASVA